MIIIYFTIYVIIISSLAWFMSRPKPVFYDGGFVPPSIPPGEYRILHDGVMRMLHGEPHFATITPRLTKEELKRFTKSLCQFGYSAKEFSEAATALSTAMDKVCDGKT